MNYRDYNDNELLFYLCENHEEASEIIFHKYEPLIRTIANKFYKCCKNSGLDLNDLIQEGMIALNAAINNYDEQRNTTFYNFAEKCIERKIMSAIVGTQRNKSYALNNSVSLAFPDEERYKIDVVLSDKSLNPEDLVVGKEQNDILLKEIRNNLTDFELQIFDLYVAGFSYKDIGKLLEKDKKSVDNAIQRIRIKTKNILKQLN